MNVPLEMNGWETMRVSWPLVFHFSCRHAGRNSKGEGQNDTNHIDESWNHLLFMFITIILIQSFALPKKDSFVYLKSNIVVFRMIFRLNSTRQISYNHGLWNIKYNNIKYFCVYVCVYKISVKCSWSLFQSVLGVNWDQYFAFHRVKGLQSNL